MNSWQKELDGSFVKEYIDGVDGGEITVGRELKQMLAIIKANAGNPDISFDPEDAAKRIRFIERECRHFEAPFAGKPFVLTLRQKFFIEAFYSFKIFDEEAGRKVRLYQRVLLLIARKCGKTPLIAAVNLAEFFCGEAGTRILCSGNDYDQASLQFDAINAMREESRTLERVTSKNLKGISFGNRKRPQLRGKFSSQNKGWIRKISAKTGSKEGRNIKVGSVDEVWELADNRAVMPIQQALGTQEEPIYQEFTTEGFVEEGYLDATLKEARAVLAGEVENKRWLILLYTQDSEEEIFQDESSWVKSNPDLGVIKRRSYLRQMVESAKRSQTDRAFVLAKDFNLKQGSSIAWMNPDDIRNEEVFDMADFRGACYIGGFDFAETTDLSSGRLLLMRKDDPRKYLLQMYWLPEAKLEASPDGVDYEGWAKDGYIRIVPGAAVNSSIAADWEYEILERYGIQPYKCGYDNRFAKDYISRHEAIFGEGLTVNVPQDFRCLSNPMRVFEADLLAKQAVYGNHPTDYWCFCNTGFRLDKLGRIMPAKQEKTRRIDGTASALCCYAVLDWHRSEFMKLAV